MKEKEFDYCAYYDSISPKYNSIRLDSKNDFDTTISFILNHTNKNSPKLLDIGCGTGKYGECLMQHGYVVEGIDKSLAQIEQAKTIISAQVGDVCALPFASESYDICTMIMMIHHLSRNDRIQAFREAHRVLRKGGCLIIKTASHEDLAYRLSSRFFPEAYEIDLRRYPPIETLLDEMACFSKVHSQAVVSKTSFDPKSMALKLAQRRTSNLGMLSEEALQKGIERFNNVYCNQMLVEKENHCTFIVAVK